MALLDLLTEDAPSLLTVLEGALFPPWGVYYKGIPIIAPSTPRTRAASSALSRVLAPLQTIAQFAPILGITPPPNLIPVAASIGSFEYRQDWNVSNYPVELGAFQSYDKVQMPFDVRVKAVNSGQRSERQIFLNTIDAMCNSLLLFDVVTPEKVYLSCNPTHFDFRREATNGAVMLQVDIWFVQIRQTATAAFSNTQQPPIAGQLSSGNVQTGSLTGTSAGTNAGAIT